MLDLYHWAWYNWNVELKNSTTERYRSGYNGRASKNSSVNCFYDAKPRKARSAEANLSLRAGRLCDRGGQEAELWTRQSFLQLNTERYRSGHNEAVLKNSCLCHRHGLESLDFIGFSAHLRIPCEKVISQFSRNYHNSIFTRYQLFSAVLIYGGLSKRS